MPKESAVAARKSPGVTQGGAQEAQATTLAALLRAMVHQLNQPLTVCRGSIELALLPGRSIAECRASCQRALAAAERLVRLVQDLQALSDGPSLAGKSAK